MLQQITDYFHGNMDAFIQAALQHTLISIISLLVAGIIGIAGGCFAAGSDKGEKWITGFFQILRIIPSLAILIMLLPIMGTGVKPVMTALVLLAVPPILMNTASGLRDVPDFMIETAEAIGMTKSQVFWKVKMPLAMPMIFVGLKTASVEIVASATLASKIGAGGFGDLIFTGLGLNRIDLLLIGGVSVAVLSLLFSNIIELIGRLFMKYKTALA